MEAIISSLKKMPYGIRYIAMQMKDIMNEKFPGNATEVIQCVGNLIYYRYMNPAIVAPEAFDVIESAISPTQRKNLAEVAKTLHQISVCKTQPLHQTTNNGTIAPEDVIQSELNSYIRTSARKFRAFFSDASTVISSEEFFNMDQFLDMSRQQKPSIIITPNEVFQVHESLVQNVDDLTTDKNDPLRIILNDLAVVPKIPEKQLGEVHLNLVNRFAKLDDEEELKLKHLITDTKRLLMMIIRVQHGKNLLDVLEAPVKESEEALFQEISKEETEKYQMSREKKEEQQQQRRGSQISLAASSEAGMPLGSHENVSSSMFFGSGSYFCLKADYAG
jgi:hypothetical protein